MIDKPLPPLGKDPEYGRARCDHLPDEVAPGMVPRIR